jgi:phosphatidate cytidylyltransferase
MKPLRDLFPSCLCYFINIILFSTESFSFCLAYFSYCYGRVCNFYLNKVIPFLLKHILFYQITIATNGLLSQLRFNNTFDLTVLGFTLFVFLKCIHFLLIIKLSKLIPFQNISDRLRYPSICYYDKIPLE